MTISIVMLPLISSIGSGLFGRFLGTRGAGILATLCLGITAIFSIILGYEIFTEGTVVYVSLLDSWIESGLFSVSLGFRFDSLTAMMLILVTIISGLVHLYSIGYMSGDPHVPRFMSYLSLFTFFMIVLVTGDNLIQLFIGWEGVGLCSYLLINFWYTRIQAAKSALKAMIMNRIGDFGLILGILATYYTFGATDYETIFALAPSANRELITLIGILFLIGAVGKSAQLGLHTWLPDAMMAPTPVSALIHSSTMVTAGVFLLIRNAPLLELSSTALFYITIVGALTALLGASIAIFQNDIKAVIAYSTISQLGYMVFACGLAHSSVSLLHLWNHGFFKALLFLSAGAIIHALAEEQDIRKMGGLIYSLPLTYSLMLIGSMSLMGIPFMSGFFTKDAIIEAAFTNYSIHGTFAHWLGTLTVCLTAIYSVRLIYLTFLSTPQSSRAQFSASHEPTISMVITLCVLALASIFGIFDFAPAIQLWPFLGLIYFIIPSGIFPSVQSFFASAWHIDWLYNRTIAKPILHLAHLVSYKTLDRGLWDPGASLLLEASKTISSLQSGYLYHYAFVIFTATTLFFALSFLSPLPLFFLLPLLCIFF